MAVDWRLGALDTIPGFNKPDDYVTKLFDQAAQYQSGRQYAAGDYQAAAATRAGRGDIAGAQAIQKSGVEQFQAQHEYIRRAVPVFQAALQQGGPQAVINAFQHVIPDLKGMGASDQQIQEWSQRFQSDPQGTIQALSSVARVEYEYKTVGNTLYVFDKANPQTPIGMFEGSAPDKFVVVPHDSDLVRTGGGGQAPGTATEIPIQQPTGGAAPSSPPAGGGAAPAQAPGAPVPIAPRPQAALPPSPPAGRVVDRGIVSHAAPPPDATSLGLPNPERVNPAAFGPQAQAAPEGAPASAVPGSGVSIVARGRTTPPKASASGFNAAADPKTVQYWAGVVLSGGKLPPLGAGAAPLRAAILKAVAEQSAAIGLNPQNLVGIQTDLAANKSALTQLVRYANMVEQFSGTMDKSAQYALSLLDKGAADGGSPLANRGIQWWRRNVRGDPNLAKFEVAVNTLVTEYAKIMSGSTGAAGATEGARQHAMELLNTADTPAAFKARVEALRTEVDLRHDQLDEQQNILRGFVNAPPRETPAPAPSAVRPSAAPKPAAPARQPTVEELLRKYGH